MDLLPSYAVESLLRIEECIGFISGKGCHQVIWLRKAIHGGIWLMRGPPSYLSIRRTTQQLDTELLLLSDYRFPNGKLCKKRTSSCSTRCLNQQPLILKKWSDSKSVQHYNTLELELRKLEDVNNCTCHYETIAFITYFQRSTWWKSLGHQKMRGLRPIDSAIRKVAY